jgi:hypothetical protein
MGTYRLTRAFVVLTLLLLAGCANRPFVGVTISNSPESIESCGRKTGGC